MAAIEHSRVSKNTMHDILAILEWSLFHAFLGQYPQSRSMDQGGWQEEAFGRGHSVRSALIRITGDWKMWKDIFKFPQWNETAGLLLSMCCNSGRAQRHWPLSTLAAQAPQTILLAMTELHSCCECLSTGQGASLPEHSRRFASLHVALETTEVEPFGVKPRVHLFQELAEYRDEDFGGTVAGLGRRRGGPRTIAATGSQVLQRFVGRHQVPVLT